MYRQYQLCASVDKFTDDFQKFTDKYRFFFDKTLFYRRSLAEEKCHTNPSLLSLPLKVTYINEANLTWTRSF